MCFLRNLYALIQVMQEELLPNSTANGVRDFGDGMANAEVGMNLKTPVSLCDIIFTLLISVLFVRNMCCVQHFCVRCFL